jgi:septum formation protein
MENTKFCLILASASPRRKELLGHLQLPFEVFTLNVPEESSAKNPALYCQEIAKLKGEAAFQDLQKKRATTNLFVVSADTIVCLGSKIYGKPKDMSEAEVFLKELAGKTHSVFTAVAIKFSHGGTIHEHSFVEESKVSFGAITEDLMSRYLGTKDSLDKAGAYGIQGPSLTFVNRVEGDYANVVGFPLSRFVLECEKLLNAYVKDGSWFTLF